MISLGIGELVSSSSFILRTFFGGEEGITTNRAKLAPLFGLRFGPQIEVYYLIAIWCLLCIAAMYALTRTPFGRICNAVRDNPERVLYIGYSAQRIRLIAFSFAGFFAGIAGGLAAINFEIMNAQQLGAQQSGLVLLMAYIGGVGVFAGPIIGAIIITFLQINLSDLTSAWQLYFGLLFIGVVSFAPGGVAGLLMRHREAARSGELWRLAPAYAAVAPGLAAGLIGAVMLIELANRQLAMARSEGSAMTLFGFAVDASSIRALGGGARPVSGRRRGHAASLAEGRRRLGRRQQGASREGPRMTAALELTDVTKNFGLTQIIRGVTLQVGKGERHAIIGPNGAGKSTLFHLVSGRIKPTSGEIKLDGERIDGLAPFEIYRRGLARSFQITNIFPKLSVLREPALRDPLVARLQIFLLAADRRPARRSRENGVADGADRPDRAPRRSGRRPELRRPALARNRRDHRRRRAGDPARRADGGNERGRERTCGRADPEGERRTDARHGRARHGGRLRSRRPHFGAGLRADRRQRHPRADSRQRRGPGGLSRPDGGPMTTPLLEVDGLNAHYGKSHILQGVAFRIGGNEIVSLLGRNGVGRSTTIKAVMGDVRPKGSIRFKGEEIAGLKPHETARRGLGYVPETRDIFPSLTVRQNLLLGEKPGKAGGRWTMADMFRIFPRLEERAETPAACCRAASRRCWRSAGR